MSNAATDDSVAPREGQGFLSDDDFDRLLAADPRMEALWRDVKSMVVATKRHESIDRFLRRALQTSGMGREAECSLLYGMPGVGKSTAIRCFCDEFLGPFETRSGTKRPVLLVETPSKPTLVNLYEKLLESLGMSEWTGKLNDMKRLFKVQVAVQSVRLVIFDEFTHVIEDRTEKFSRHVAREVKEFLNEQLFNVVFAGTEELLSVYGLYDQLGRRSGGDLHVTPFDWQDEDDRDEWIGLLGTLSEAIPVKPATSLHQRPMAEKLHRACDGNMSGLMKLLCAASAKAFELKDDRLLEEHLWGGFDESRNALRKNPNVGFGKTRTRDVDHRNPFERPKGRPSRPRLLPPPEPKVPTGNRSNGPKSPHPRDTFTK